jgi:hypothetical protein
MIVDAPRTRGTQKSFNPAENYRPGESHFAHRTGLEVAKRFPPGPDRNTRGLRGAQAHQGRTPRPRVFVTNSK